MGALQKIFGKYRQTATQDQVGGTLDRLKGVHEMLADAVEATEKLDIVEALKEASPWAEAVGNALGDVLPPVRFVLKLLGELNKIEDPGELGYLAATLAYQQAVEQAWQAMPAEARARLKAADPQLRKKALAELRAATPAEAYNFSRFSFHEALSSPFMKDAEKFLEMSVRGLLDEPAYRNLQHGVRVRFVANLKGILSHGSTRERFAPFRERMTLGTPEARAYDALHEHADYQRWLYEEQHVVGSEPFTLAEVYTETDCGVLRWAECRQVEVDPFNEQFGGRQPLVETVLGLIADPKFEDAIVIQGVAGSGKSSATVRLAWELLRQGLRPIRIELKHLDVRDDVAIEEALPAAVHLTSRERDPEAKRLDFGKDLFLGGAIFNEYVHFRGTKICPYVVILDGWDEISVGASEGYQQRVERMLDGVRRLYLEQSTVPVRVVLAGRPTQAIEAGEFLRSSTRILSLRDFSPAQLRAYIEKMKAVTASKEGSWDLEKVTVLPALLERYGAPGPSGRSLEILGLPLLAHLALRLLAALPEKAEQLLDNTTSLYRNLVDLVVSEAGKPEGRAMLKGEMLRQLLRGTAEAMTTLAVESIPHDELAVRLGLKDPALRQRVDRLSDEQVLSRLMSSFFFRGGRTELGAEFSHKSFREYLFAEQIVEAVKAYGREARRSRPERPKDEYWKDFEEKDPRRKLCHRLIELLGPVWLTPEISRHLRRLLAWEIERAHGLAESHGGASTQPLKRAGWEHIRDGLADAWDWWGEGVHLRPQPTLNSDDLWEYKTQDLALRTVEKMRLLSDHKKQPIPACTTSIDAHLGDGLFLLVAGTHTELALRVGWRPGEAASSSWSSVRKRKRSRRYQVRLFRKEGGLFCFEPTGPEGMFLLSCCARINAAGYRPQGPFPAGTYLSGAYLAGAYLRGAHLSEADLSGAYLRGADLSGADLSRADLGVADLSVADLRGANLRRADLRRADLRGANLNGADLRVADLREADLRGAYLCGADLGADFSGADLRGADFKGADLREAHLNGANLSRADLRDASVDPEQLKLAITDESTRR